MEIALIKELVPIFGTTGTVVVLLVWYFLNRKEKHTDNGSRNQVREAIITMDTNMSHVMDDVKEIKEDVKDVQKTVTQHLRDHAKV